MLILASATDKLRLITGSAGQVTVHASWMDNVSGAIAPGRTNTAPITTATTTDIVPSPSAGVFRNIKTLHVHNAGGAANTVTVVHTDGTTPVELHRAVLGPAETLQYIDEVGFIASASAQPFTTGDAKLTFKAAPDTGWVFMNDGTVGDASSGSSTRANADCEQLFTLLFNNITDTWAPLATSSGVPTTRAAQGSAAGAWAAHCRMALPRQLGRAICAAGAGPGLTARALGQLLGEETHSQTSGETGTHYHTIASSHGYLYTTGSTHELQLASPGTGIVFYDTTNYALSTDAAGGSIPFNVMQPSVFWNVMIKL